MPGLLSNMNEDMTITRKMEDGTTMTFKSPTGAQTDMSGLMSSYAMGGNIQNYEVGGMINGYAPTPVADNKNINVTPGEFVVNLPAAQKYAPLLEQINNEGKQMLAMGGWTNGANNGMNFRAGGIIPEGFGGNTQGAVNNPGIQRPSQGFGYSGVGGSDSGRALPSNIKQQYPPNVVLDPALTPPSEFDRMDQLVRNGIYTIDEDRAGRAIYQLTALGNSHNVRAEGSGVENMGVTQGAPVDNYHPYSGVSADPVMDNTLANFGTEGGRGMINEQMGAREDVARYGQAGQAPSVTPEGSRIQYKAGQSYNVASKEQATQFVQAGIVQVGAMFVLPDGTTGRAS